MAINGTEHAARALIDPDSSSEDAALQASSTHACSDARQPQVLPIELRILQAPDQRSQMLIPFAPRDRSGAGSTRQL
jgi:hypothetical protein